MPRPVHTPLTPVRIELPNGDRYHLHPRPADLEGFLAPEREPHLAPGITPVRILVHPIDHAAYAVSLAPDELEELLRRADREKAELAGQPPPRPLPEEEPAPGRGQRDPEAHRLGPNVAEPPDPGHRGAHRLRRRP